jgi:hypothetical protein
VFFFGTLLLVALAFSGWRQAVQPLTLLLMATFSLIIGHRIYKSRYHMTITLNSRGFQIKEGSTVKGGKWSDYTDVTVYITPRRETCLRLHAGKESFDLPISRAGISRKEAYNTIKQLIAKK